MLGLAALGWSDDLASERSTAARDGQVVHRSPARGPTRPPIHGTSFPDGVLALTWDDGPDVNTLELAQYLRSQRVSATFFVVGEWIDGVSEEPGVGASVHSTGYRHLPLLADVVALGHRIGSHNENHVLLGGAAEVDVAAQLGESQRDIDPFLTNELRIFRAPAGYFSRSAAAAIAEPFFSDLVGPFHWDIDAKDWEGSLYCGSSKPAECEPGPLSGRARVRPRVIAHRYVQRVESMRRGIVLMHDRVGDVGSGYALDVARELVPQLEARGFVFAAPVLAFGPLTPRLASEPGAVPPGSSVFADVDGDGRDDLCREYRGSIRCAYAVPSPPEGHAVPRTMFDALDRASNVPDGLRSMDAGDVDGDGRADLCLMTDEAIDCALARDRTFGKLRRWSTQLTPLHGSIYARSFRLADVNGDGRADACALIGEGILCAASTGAMSFGPPRLWLGARIVHDGAPLSLADIDRDGRADFCGIVQQRPALGAKTRGIQCALSSGHSFGPIARWSAPGDLEAHGAMQLGDLNGDGRADVCVADGSGVRCALSNGRGFKASSIWSEMHASGIRLADINGDGRSDLCSFAGAGVDCGLAP